MYGKPLLDKALLILYIRIQLLLMIKEKFKMMKRKIAHTLQQYNSSFRCISFGRGGEELKDK